MLIFVANKVYGLIARALTQYKKLYVINYDGP